MQKTIKKITKIHRGPNATSNKWRFDVEYEDGTTGPQLVDNGVFMGLCLKLREKGEENVPTLPKSKDIVFA